MLNVSYAPDTTTSPRSPNREHATRRLRADIERGDAFSILLVRFDGLGGATSGHGSVSTDAVWRRVLGVLTKDLTRKDVCSRVGDEEFLLILRDRTAEETRDLVETMNRRWMSLAGAGAREGDVDMRIGVASYPEQSGTVQGLFAIVDAALYVGAVDITERLRGGPALGRVLPFVRA